MPTYVVSKLQLALTLLAALHGLARGNKPVFDLANNMRVVLLPADTKIGTIIYKLRASDADDDYPLTFRVFGTDSKMIDILNVDCSKMICEADVVLMSNLNFAGKKYHLSLEVKDTKGERTVVQTEIQTTRQSGPFIGAPKIIKVSEVTRPKTLLESFIITENPNLFRGIRCQLWPKSARKYFEMSSGLPSPIRGESRCDLRLRKYLDFESRSSFVLHLVAENAWVDNEVDTRNVATHEFIVEVLDVQDTAPFFLSAPPVTRLPETAKQGDAVMQIQAFDGDYANPRRIRYGLDPKNLPFSSYFQIDPDSGVISVRKSLQDMETRPYSPVMLRVVAEELKGPNEVSSEYGNSISKNAVQVAIIIDDVIDRKPKFLQDHYITNLVENAIEGTTLHFDGGLNIVEDLDKGENGIVELFIPGEFGTTFEVSPSVIENSGHFTITVVNNKKLNYEKLKTVEFEIVARELGVNKLSSSAKVTVNLLDENDNSPKFDQEKYHIKIRENEKNGKVILKVHATDMDSGQNGQILYTRLLGEDPIIHALRLDQNSGEISVINGQLIDREFSDKHIISVEAVDKIGKISSESKTSLATIEIEILDENDQRPKFLKKKYEGFMNKDLTRLRNHLQVEAVDNDQKDSKNSEIRYEIIKGNYEKKFGIDERTGEITVKEPLAPGLVKISRRNANPEIAKLDSSIVDPVITLIVRAYDLGIPSFDSEVAVHIFTEEVSSRTMRFIIDESPEKVEKEEDKISDLISTMTGGEAEIQDIQPYFGDKFENLDNGDQQLDREGKEVEIEAKKTLVDVFIRYPVHSIVDINAVTSKLISNNTSGTYLQSQGNNGRDDAKTEMEQLETENAALIWVLLAICLLIVFIVAILFCCYCCPGCYCYRTEKEKSVVSADGSEREIQILTVKDGEGKELKDAKFVEILKSARDRIRSAASLRGSNRIKAWRNDQLRASQDSLYHQHIVASDTSSIEHQKQFQTKPNQDSESIILVREAKGSPLKKMSGNPFLMKELEQLNVQALDDPDFSSGFPSRRSFFASSHGVPDRGRIFKIVEPEERNSSRQGGEDVQILRLDDETRREETYKKIGNAEILSLDQTNHNLDPNDVEKERSKSLEEKPTMSSEVTQTEIRRSLSDLDLDKIRQNIPEGEFFTVTGPDGKEIILRRYLNDQAPDSSQINESQYQDSRGFLNMAMYHLQQQQLQQLQEMQEKQHLYHQHFMSKESRSYPNLQEKSHPNLQEAGFESGDEFNDDGELSSDPPSIRKVKKKRPKKIKINPGSIQYLGNPDNNPNNKSVLHQIRTPIIEETESNLEAELQRSRGHDIRYTVSLDNSDASILRLRLNNNRNTNGRNSPEPAYTETKASILRRRNTMAKLLQEEEQAFRAEQKERLRNRHSSLNDLNRSSRYHEINRDAKMRRWNSLSNDELFVRPDMYYDSNRGNHFLHPHFRPNLNASQQVQMFPHTPSLYNNTNPHQSNSKKVKKYGPIYPESSFNTPNRGAREPIWSRLTNSIKSVYKGKRRNQYKQQNQQTRGHQEQHYIYPDQMSTEPSSEITSRSSSVASLGNRDDLGRMIEEGQNSRAIVDENLARNIGVTPESIGRPGTNNSKFMMKQVSSNTHVPTSQEVPPYDTLKHYKTNLTKQQARQSPEKKIKKSEISPRYMEWYNNTKENDNYLRHRLLEHPTLVEDNVNYPYNQEHYGNGNHILNDNAVYQQETIANTEKPPSQDISNASYVNNALIKDEDDESGISSLSQNHSHRPKKRSNANLLEKKSVFTIAYQDMNNQSIQPDTQEEV